MILLGAIVRTGILSIKKRKKSKILWIDVAGEDIKGLKYRGGRLNKNVKQMRNNKATPK